MWAPRRPQDQCHLLEKHTFKITQVAKPQIDRKRHSVDDMLFASFEIKNKRSAVQNNTPPPLPFTHTAPSSQDIIYTQHTFMAPDEDTSHPQENTKIKQHTRKLHARPHQSTSLGVVSKVRARPLGAGAVGESRAKADQTSPIPTFRHPQLFIEIPRLGVVCMALAGWEKRGRKNGRKDSPKHIMTQKRAFLGSDEKEREEEEYQFSLGDNAQR